jgi:hypothetical protein
MGMRLCDNGGAAARKYSDLGGAVNAASSSVSLAPCFWCCLPVTAFAGRRSRPSDCTEVTAVVHPIEGGELEHNQVTNTGDCIPLY